MARYIQRTYACPDNGCRFDYLHTVENGVEEPPPRFCPKCGADCESDNEPIPMFGKIGRQQNQTLDKTYRQMESSSVARAQEAADMQGVPVSEMSNIKITNMKDNLREGDTSFIAPPSQTAAVMAGNVAPASSSEIAALRGAALGAPPPQGGLRPPSAGTLTLDKIRPIHAQRARAMAKAGEIGSYSGRR